MFDVVFTGPAPKLFGKQLSRQDMLAMATKRGDKARTSFCSKTTLVVAPDETFGSAKLAKAADKGVKVVTYKAYLAKKVTA
jgi:NAD-dependent DNA ligase